MYHSRKKLNLIGQKFGKLTVLSPTSNIGKKTAWICRCDCGNKLKVKTCHLRSGNVKSCGCDNKKYSGLLLNYIDGTCVEMLRSKNLRSNNTSGVTGVDWMTSAQRWRATICFKGKRYYLGRYQKFEDAVSARRVAERNLHDRFLHEFDKSYVQKYIDATQTVVEL